MSDKTPEQILKEIGYEPTKWLCSFCSEDAEYEDSQGNPVCRLHTESRPA